MDSDNIEEENLGKPGIATIWMKCKYYLKAMYRPNYVHRKHCNTDACPSEIDEWEPEYSVDYINPYEAQKNMVVNAFHGLTTQEQIDAMVLYEQQAPIAPVLQNYEINIPPEVIQERRKLKMLGHNTISFRALEQCGMVTKKLKPIVLNVKDKDNQNSFFALLNQKRDWKRVEDDLTR